jgi:redox-sensitive bicupin YhaK (pirin superfamily)
VSYDLGAGRRAYLFVIAGSVTVGGEPLEPGDSARVEDEPRVAVTAARPSDLLLLDLP